MMRKATCGDGHESIVAVDLPYFFLANDSAGK